jgi:hypothetical protein
MESRKIWLKTEKKSYYQNDKNKTNYSVYSFWKIIAILGQFMPTLIAF